MLVIITVELAGRQLLL